MLLGIAFCAILLQIIFQFILWYGQKRLQSMPALPKPESSATIVIAFKNEAKNLPLLIDDLKRQNHSSFECLLVNDHSTDDSIEVATKAIEDDARFRILENTGKSGKKGALALGIREASNNAIALTDADCRIPKSWLTKIVSSLSQSVAVIGVGYVKPKQTALSEAYAFETAKSALQFTSFAALGAPYMAVGRSMGVTKPAFQSVGGFTAHQHIESGSDDLLIQSLAGKPIDVRADAVTWTKAPKTWNDWVIQRKRHMTTGSSYPLWVGAFIIAYDASNVLTSILFFFAIKIFTPLWLGWLVLFGIKTFWSKNNYDLMLNQSPESESLRNLWWYEYPQSWLNSLISISALWMKPEGWTVKR